MLLIMQLMTDIADEEREPDLNMKYNSYISGKTHRCIPNKRY